jgi:hypothetical protein
MTDEIIETKTLPVNSAIRINYLELEQHLFEAYLNDHIENQIQRMMDQDMNLVIDIPHEVSE